MADIDRRPVMSRADLIARIVGLEAEVRRLSTRADTAETRLREAQKAWGDLYYKLPSYVHDGYSWHLDQLDAALAVPSPDITTPRAEQAGDDHS